MYGQSQCKDKAVGSQSLHSDCSSPSELFPVTMLCWVPAVTGNLMGTKCSCDMVLALIASSMSVRCICIAIAAFA